MERSAILGIAADLSRWPPLENSMKTMRKSGMPHLAASVAPEDLNTGDFVAVLNVVYEFPSFIWCCDCSHLQPDETVQIKFRASGAGTPLKIKAICLPFVFVKKPDGKSQTLDVRQNQLVRLNSEYAQAVWKASK